MNIEKFEEKLSRLSETIIPLRNLKKGISIVVPVFDGIDHIKECLDSFHKQVTSTARYEVILVLNGSFYDDLLYIIENNYNDMDILVLINDKASAGHARNVGMKYVKYSHVTFVDVDDYISDNYIQAHFDLIDTNVITISQIIDVDNGNLVEDNVLRNEVVKSSKLKNVPLMKVQRIATITTCKVIPIEIALLQKFRENLRSGEDTVFYSELFVNSRPILKIIPLESNAIYYRRIRENSVSRKESSFDFLVFQRLEIIEILDSILNSLKNPTLIKFINYKYSAQISFIKKYIELNPNKREYIFNLIKSLKYNHFNYKILNSDLAETLVLAYCFPPYSDTSATIVSKRILESNQVVDVVSNNMNNIRTKELTLHKMIAPLLGNVTTVNVPASFSNMYYLNEFIDRAFKVYLKNYEKYKVLYSRAMFPVSHIPGYFIKLLNPNVKWIAEFSDPLFIDIESEERYSSIDNTGFLESLKMGQLGIFSDYVDDNLFNLVEIIPFALADELVFTNQNQLEFMMERFGDEQRKLVYAKAKISEHPSLPQTYYHIEKARIDLESSIINIAYFGNFYSKRSFEQFIEITNALNRNSNQIFQLHIFTNINQLSSESIEVLNTNDVKLYDYLPFTQYLNALTQFDLLLINDALTSDTKKINPYLPSKLSDYLASGTHVLGITEKDSIMSKKTHKNFYQINFSEFNSRLNNRNTLDGDLLSELTKEIELRKRKNSLRYLYDNESEIILFSNNKELLVSSKDLSLENIGIKEWIILPKELPVSPNKDYSVRIHNKLNVIKQIQLKSFYSVPNVIEIHIYDHNNKKLQNIPINKIMRNIYYVTIPENSSIKIKINYLRTYTKEGFLKAGRLKISGV